MLSHQAFALSGLPRLYRYLAFRLHLIKPGLEKDACARGLIVTGVLASISKEPVHGKVHRKQCSSLPSAPDTACFDKVLMARFHLRAWNNI
jgi:hypothetical protein